MKYEPYNFESFKELLGITYGLGFFPGTKEAFTLKAESGFEAFSGRASETWEVRFVLTLMEITRDDGKIMIPQKTFKGSTIKEVCDQAIAEIKSLTS